MIVKEYIISDTKVHESSNYSYSFLNGFSISHNVRTVALDTFHNPKSQHLFTPYVSFDSETIRLNPGPNFFEIFFPIGALPIYHYSAKKHYERIKDSSREVAKNIIEMQVSLDRREDHDSRDLLGKLKGGISPLILRDIAEYLESVKLTDKQVSDSLEQLKEIQTSLGVHNRNLEEYAKRQDRKYTAGYFLGTYLLGGLALGIYDIQNDGFETESKYEVGNEFSCTMTFDHTSFSNEPRLLKTTLLSGLNIFAGLWNANTTDETYNVTGYHLSCLRNEKDYVVNVEFEKKEFDEPVPVNEKADLESLLGMRIREDVEKRLQKVSIK